MSDGWEAFPGAEEYHELCKSIGRDYARRFPEVVEADDVEQECCVTLLSNWATWSAAKVDPDRFPGYVKTALDRTAKEYCRKERAELYHHSAQYTYRPEAIRKALPSWFLYENWQNGVQLPDDYQDGEPCDDLAFMGDISRVWDQLSGHHQASLRLYVETASDPDSALTGAQRMTVTRAVDQLTALMNGSRRTEGPGMRQTGQLVDY